jgi:hypothetical protein
LYSRDIIVFRHPPRFLKAKTTETLGHLIDEVNIDLFLIEVPLLLLRTIDEIELLRLVEVLLVGIVEDMSGKERDLLWNIGLHLLISEVIF